MLTLLIQHLRQRSDLDEAQVLEAVGALAAESVPTEAKADFLTALALKGESTAELAGFARALRERAVPVPLDATTRAGEILDVCGTGGDHLHTFNISTTAALVCAAAGVPVAKHGNRAITSKSGSADVLEALRIPIDLAPTDAAQSLSRHGFVFLFAPRYHPAFRHIAPARKLCAERGQRTLFNLLGPLLNPALPTVQLLGVPSPALCEPLARVLQSLGLRRGMVVCGQVPGVNGQSAMAMDEFSTLGPTTVADFGPGRDVSLGVFDATALPLQQTSLKALAGGDAQANAQITRRLLQAEERGARRDAVLLNAGAALVVAGKVDSIAAGWSLAATVIDDGRAAAKLDELSAA